MDELSAQRLMVVEPVVRRILGARVSAGAVDDLVQATMERLTEPAQRLTVEELTAYAVVAAENASRSFHRTSARRQRLELQAAEPDRHEGPEGEVVAAESAAALRRALKKLDPTDAALLNAHHVDGSEVSMLARNDDRTEMAVRVQLARARARLRVGYVLEQAGAQLPTERCRRVLDALSSGDKRLQDRLEADDHLAGCEVCRSLVASVVGRRRPVIAAIPVLALWWRSLSSAGRRAVSVGAGAGAVAAVVAVAAVAHQDASRPPHSLGAATTSTAGRPNKAVGTTATSTTTPGPIPTPTPPPSSAPVSLPTTTPPLTPGGRVRTAAASLPSSPLGLGSASGAVTATSVPVLAVPADEGFWVAADDGGGIWVELVSVPGESAVRVSAGDTVSFTGRLVPHDPGFAGAVGVDADEGSSVLTAQGHHVEVEVTQLRDG